MFPAQSFTNRQRHEELSEWYWSWFSELPSGHLKRFVEIGLRSFLRTHGYELNQPYKKAVRSVSEWAFSHVQIENQKGKDLVCALPPSQNEYCEDEWNEFCMTIPTEAWSILCDEWAETEFLDQSDAGYAQRINLPYFAWRLIYLDGSPAHHKWLDNMAIQEQADEEIYGFVYTSEEPAQAYGGDRRTL